MKLEDYDKNGNICDYGDKSCTHYQRFGIEKIIPHSAYNNVTKANDIALIRLDREIQFGTKTKPICLQSNLIGIHHKIKRFMQILLSATLTKK